MIGAMLLAATVSLPKVDILYPPHGSIFDRTCGRFAKENTATEELIEGAKGLRPQVEAQWAVEGPKYLSVAFGEIGAPFPYGEMQATLSVCSVSTMSTPLIMNVRQYLPGAARPAPLADFSEKLFHELMHHYVASITGDMPLRKKYSAESLVVLNHLHVMALEKLALTRLGKTDELKFLDEEYRNAPPDYKRAWEIVNDVEGYETFVKELKDAARRR
jgi:hypothetical protein